MQIFDPLTGNQVNIIDLAAERLKRSSDPFKNDPPPIQSDPGDEIQESCGNVFADLGLPEADLLLARAKRRYDITLKSYNDGTRDKV